MRFLKEYIVLFVIILFVFLTEFITVKITNNYLKNINYYISDVEKEINNNNVEKKMNELSNEWHKAEINLSYYMEHNELDKISADIVDLRSNLRNINDNNYDDIKELIEEIKYRLEYIKNKQKLSLKNVF